MLLTNTDTLLFDLDGTLIDTAPDMARALNQLRAQYQLQPLPFAHIRPVVSQGGAALVRLAFGPEPTEDALERLRQEFLQYYAEGIARESKLFEGIADLLSALEGLGMQWGVVTNKPGWLTEPLLAAMNLSQRAACIVSGDTVAERKPHPLPLVHACELVGTEVWRCVYVGDARRDVEAGRAAGMRTVVARYGYLAADDPPEQWAADVHIDHPHELLEWLARNA